MPQPDVFTDAFSEFSGGMQSGVSPLILQKNQFAMGVNCSIRGGFIHTRPPYIKKVLSFPDSSFESILSGKFQGAGYYRPDYGTESLIAQIDGKLAKFTENGANWSVTDISVPGDLNSVDQNQVWMWQAEKWMIVNDGSGNLPIFFDGTSSRRSYGASALLGTTAQAFTPPNPRVIGETIAITLTAPYTGPFNIPVLFNQEYYQTVQSQAGYYITIGNYYSNAWNFKAGYQLWTTTSPAFLIGVLLADAYLGPNDRVVALIDRAYNGPGFDDPNRLNVKTDAFLVAFPVWPADAPPIPANTIYLTNLTDTKTTTIPAGTKIMSVPELPAGRMGAYGNGRNWFSLTDGISYQAGDIVGGAAGSVAYDYRDSVLKMTENDYLASGGAFHLPGTGDIITAMTFPAQMDTSLGNGQLEIFTAFSGFSNNAPADRQSWSVLTYPIETQNLKGRGALGQNSTIDVNSDTFFRSSIGVGSLVIARREFLNNSWGNKPISNEMQRVLNNDDQSLLQYGSAADFDNRYLGTCSPYQSNQGIVNTGLVSLNRDLLSSLRGDLPPSWEGVWTGLNILQVITGRVNGSIRTFAFTSNLLTNKIELYELLDESTTKYLDNDTTPIVSVFETGAAFNKDVKQLTQLVKLASGKLYLSELKGSVNVKVYFKPDFYPCWTLWRDFTLCSTVGEGNQKPGYKMPIQLGEPSVQACETENNRPLNFGYFFQFRFVITGSFKFNAFFPRGIAIPTPNEPVIGCSDEECQSIACEQPDDLRLYSLQGFPT